MVVHQYDNLSRVVESTTNRSRNILQEEKTQFRARHFKYTTVTLPGELLDSVSTSPVYGCAESALCHTDEFKQERNRNIPYNSSTVIIISIAVNNNSFFNW